MKQSAWSIMVLGFASCLASANTTVIQAPSITSTPPAAAQAANDKTSVGECYALDAPARHECIYAALVRGRKTKSEIVN